MADSTAVKDISKLLSGSVLARLLGLGALMLFARILPKTEMAVFPAYLTLVGLPSLFLSLGTFQTLVRKLPLLVREDFAAARSLVVTASVLILSGTVVVCLLSLPFADRIAEYFFRDPDKAWIIRLSLIGCVAATMSKIAEFVMWGTGRFGDMSIVLVIESIIRPSLTVALYFAFGLRGIVTGLVASQIVMAAVSLWYVRGLVRGALPPLYPPGRLLRESFPFYIDNYLWYLKGDGDTLLVALLGPAALAEYYIAKNLYLNVQLGWISLDKVALERLARLAPMSDVFRERAREIHARITSLAVPALLLFIAIAPYAIIVLAGPRYADAVWPAVALLVVALLQFVNIANNRAVFVGLPGTYRLSTSAVEAAGVLIAAACLVPPAGVLGVALARIAGPAAGGVYASLLLHRKFGVDLPWRPALRALAASAPVTLAILLLAPGANTARDALLKGMAAGLFWLAAFALLTFAFNRPVFEDAAAFLMRRWKAVFQS